MRPNEREPGATVEPVLIPCMSLAGQNPCVFACVCACVCVSLSVRVYVYVHLVYRVIFGVGAYDNSYKTHTFTRLNTHRRYTQQHARTAHAFPNHLLPPPPPLYSGGGSGGRHGNTP